MTNTMTPKQVSLIASLSAERVVPEALALTINRFNQNTTTKDASNAISALFLLPRKQKDMSALVKALRSVPKAKYAIPADTADIVLRDTKTGGDLLFIETVERNKRVYMNRLHGAPGDFSRSRLSERDQIALAAVVRENSLYYTQKFGDEHQCCGKCAAPLTDDESRAARLGPVCRKAWGL